MKTLVKMFGLILMFCFVFLHNGVEYAYANDNLTYELCIKVGQIPSTGDESKDKMIRYKMVSATKERLEKEGIEVESFHVDDDFILVCFDPPTKSKEEDVTDLL